MNRRQLLQTAALAAAAPMILPSGIVRAGKNAPGNKLNIALIGVWGRGQAHYSFLKNENVVALCDVRESRFPDALKVFPNAKTYVDWRKCLDQKDIDAVFICTADHTHAFISNWALNRDLHVYCEKPLAITVDEARTVRSNWLKKRDKLATQVGMQRHAIPNFNRVRELILDGAIGELQAAYAWGDRKIPKPAFSKPEDGPMDPKTGYLPEKEVPPADFHWDLWLGPSPYHPYNPGYFRGGSGMNCLSWNMFWDFGAGQIGDMGSHTMDLVWNVVDAQLPLTAEAKGDPFDPGITPVQLEMHWEHPKNDWRGPIRISWYQGGALPTSVKKYIDLAKVGHGAMFKGSKGYIVCDFDSRIILPYGDKADLTYYKPRTPDKVIPDIGPFQKQWLDACRTNAKTACDFEYSGNMIEMMNLGLIAYRVGKKLQYDGAAGKITNVPEANQFLTKPYREGWTING